MTGTRFRGAVVAAVVSLMALAPAAPPAAAQSVQERLNDYPTAARADYVFACMAVSGQRRDVLIRCACSIDHIASVLPYERYVEAETVLSMRQTGGERMAVFNSSGFAEEMVAELRRAQAEAEVFCF